MVDDMIREELESLLDMQKMGKLDSTWENEFIESLEDRLEETLKLTPKQRAKIHELASRYGV